MSLGIERKVERMSLMLKVKTIQRIEQIKDCPVFHINHQLWTKKVSPKAYGQIAFLEDYGIVITMTAEESNPLRRYTEKDSPVYKDSALEAFLNFAPEQPEKGYFNFEINANGAMLSEFGLGKNRKKLRELTLLYADCSANIEENSWNVLIKIPFELIHEIYGIPSLQKGDVFTCNFYKISEDPSIEHYISYSPINNPTPNFHLPEFFAKAIIE